MRAARLHHQQRQVTDRLATLGLDRATLRQVIEAGELARGSCTKHDPPNAPGFFAWAKMTRAFRDLLVPRGWTASDTDRLATVVSPDNKVAIAVATGDEGAGLAHASPRTKYPKGPATAAAVQRNCVQLDLFRPAAAQLAEANAAAARAGAITWLLLVAREGDSIRAELSVPAAVGADERVEEWAERIILDPITIQGGSNDPKTRAGEEPGAIVEVSRRT